jgi:hypothetical protein
MNDTQKLTMLRAAVENVVNGNYPGPRQERPGKCRHGVYYYDACENCINEYLIAALDISK